MNFLATGAAIAEAATELLRRCKPANFCEMPVILLMPVKTMAGKNSALTRAPYKF
jgi:hypothetical protein